MILQQSPPMSAFHRSSHVAGLRVLLTAQAGLGPLEAVNWVERETGVGIGRAFRALWDQLYVFRYPNRTRSELLDE